jgi:hypothetical protein
MISLVGRLDFPLRVLEHFGCYAGMDTVSSAPLGMSLCLGNGNESPKKVMLLVAAYRRFSDAYCVCLMFFFFLLGIQCALKSWPRVGTYFFSLD